MQFSNIPVKMTTPFGNSAGGSYIRQVPTPSQIAIQAGAASYEDGFPPVNFTPVGAGGTPPFGQDMNGLLNQATAWLRWYQAGAVAQYDSGFSTAVGGYMAGAVLASAVTPGLLFYCTADNNTVNPDVALTNWLPFGPGFTPLAANVLATLTLGSPQTLTNATRTTVLVAGTAPFATVASGVLTFTKTGIYIINGYLHTNIVTTSAQSTFGNPYIEYNSVQVAVASATAYTATAQTIISAGSVTFSTVAAIGDTVYMGAFAGTLSGSGTSSITADVATLSLTKVG